MHDNALEYLRKLAEYDDNQGDRYFAIHSDHVKELVALIDAITAGNRAMIEAYDGAVDVARWRGGVDSLEGIARGLEKGGISPGVIRIIDGVKDDAQRQLDRLVEELTDE